MSESLTIVFNREFFFASCTVHLIFVFVPISNFLHTSLKTMYMLLYSVLSVLCPFQLLLPAYVNCLSQFLTQSTASCSCQDFSHGLGIAHICTMHGFKNLTCVLLVWFSCNTVFGSCLTGALLQVLIHVQLVCVMNKFRCCKSGI